MQRHLDHVEPMVVGRFAACEAGQSTDESMFAGRVSLLTIVWIVVGVVVAAANDYFDSLDTAGRVLTAIAAILLWPLLLFGFDIRISR
jgi:hypothetical protein